MLRQTNALKFASQGAWAGKKYWLMHMFAPNVYRDYLAVQNAHKIERGLRLQQSLKANKVDIRSLLALPVTDHAHPYVNEYPWEKVYSMHQGDYKKLSLYGKFYRLKIINTYEVHHVHKFGCLSEDFVCARGWWARAARTRMPKAQCCHMDRRIVRYRALYNRFIYDPKQKWVHPVDDVSYYGPYIFMVSDEWEEKWGFFAKQDIEY
jgi:ubiquinol-cytochrome c reductase subunit 7